MLLKLSPSVPVRTTSLPKLFGSRHDSKIEDCLHHNCIQEPEGADLLLFRLVYSHKGPCAQLVYTLAPNYLYLYLYLYLSIYLSMYIYIYI